MQAEVNVREKKRTSEEFDGRLMDVGVDSVEVSLLNIEAVDKRPLTVHLQLVLVDN